MSLVRAELVRFDQDRMVVLFSMTDGKKDVSCAVSTEAMDQLDRPVRAKPDQREQQFERLKDRIEFCAAQKFDKEEFEGTPPGLVLRSIDFR